jgi:hypothetical protein
MTKQAQDLSRLACNSTKTRTVYLPSKIQVMSGRIFVEDAIAVGNAWSSLVVLGHAPLK